VRALLRLVVVLASVLPVTLPGQCRAELHAVGVAAHAAVPFGGRLTFVLERQWPAGWTAATIDDAAFAPLLGEFESASLANEGDSLKEQRRYTVRALGQGTLPVIAVRARFRGPRGESQELVATSPALAITSLLAEPIGEIEWASGMRQLAHTRTWLWVLVACVAALGSLGWWRLRHGPEPVAPGPESEPTFGHLPQHAAVLAELGSLQVPAEGDGEALAAFYERLSLLVREHAGRRFGVRALVCTSEQLVAVVPLGTPALRQCLQRCDFVKFAARRPHREDHEAARTLAIGFVLETVPEERSEVLS
jgi:hypothetical protein